jgi:hypothetical protein
MQFGGYPQPLDPSKGWGQVSQWVICITRMTQWET